MYQQKVDACVGRFVPCVAQIRAMRRHNFAIQKSVEWLSEWPLHDIAITNIVWCMA